MNDKRNDDFVVFYDDFGSSSLIFFTLLIKLRYDTLYGYVINLLFLLLLILAKLAEWMSNTESKGNSTVLVIRLVVLYKWQVHCFGVILIVLNECLVHYVTVNPKPSCIIIRGFGMVWGLFAFGLCCFVMGFEFGMIVMMIVMTFMLMMLKWCQLDEMEICLTLLPHILLR
jgi:hypothetical protein